MDHFEKLRMAVGQLQQCLRGMDVDLAEIIIASPPGLERAPAHAAFSAAVKLSPSYAELVRFSSDHRPSRAGILAELMGVRISSK